MTKPTDAPRPLSETVAEAMFESTVLGRPYSWFVAPSAQKTRAIALDPSDLQRMTDAAIAAMVTALLSETAVEAGGHRLSRGALFPHAYRTDPEYKRRSDDLAQRVIEAALRSVGATTDCGCTVTDAVDGVVDIDQCSRPGCPRAEGEG